MDIISSFVEGYSATFQDCLLAKDPVAHAKSLSDSIQKKLLLFLLDAHNANYKQELKTKYSIRGEILEAIDKWKMQTKISHAKSTDEIKYLIEQFMKSNQSRFNYTKPAEFQTAVDQAKPEQSSLPSKLKPIPTLKDWAKQQLNKKQDNIASFSKKAIQSLGEDRLLKLKLANKQRLLGMSQILRDFSDKFAVEFVKNFYDQMLKTNKNYQIPTYVYYNLTKSQFMHLKDAIPGLINKDDYLRVFFSYNYEEQLQKYQREDLTISQKDEKRKVLLKILKDLNELKTVKTKQMQRQILRELLLLDVSRQDVDKALFLQYLQDNPTSSSYQKQKFREQKVQKYKSKANYDIDIIDSAQTFSASTGEDQLVKQCIQALFKKGDAEKTLKQLQEYFESSKINKLFAIAKLSEGAKVDDYSNYLPAEQLKTFKQQRQITILDKNKKRWRAEQELTLKVRVKNVNKIHVKIYKLDIEKHYIQNGCEIDQTQDLSYLQPNHSYDYTTQTNNPYLIQIYDIKVEGIPQARGAWIIQLEGEGISSRAFIRKGAFAKIESSNSAGIQVKFYDESGIQVKDYKIWLDGKKHSVESNFTIPFGETDKSINLIVSKDGYSQQCNVYVPSQSYYLDVAYIYTTQSFNVGSIAKVLIHPRLYLGFDRTMDISFKLLEKVKILVTLTNNLGIKSTIDFDNVKFKQNQQYLLEFPIQSYTKNIDISISAKVKKYNKKEDTLTSAHSITIQLREDNTNFMDLYMKRINLQYKVYLLGKNGEPIPRTQVIIQYRAEGRNEDENQSLMTEKDGSVNLGDLKNVSTVTARVNLKSGSLIRLWNLCELDNEVEYVQNPIFKQKQQIVFPALANDKPHLWLKNNSGIYSQNLTKSIKQENHNIILKDLSIGKYALEFQTSDKRIDFEVVEGKKWEAQNKIFDEKKGTLYELDPQQNNYISLGDATFTKEADHLVINIPIRGTYDMKKDDTIRAHLLASNFMLPNFTGKFTAGNVRSYKQFKQQFFNTKQSSYYNNKKLAQEISYAINRKTQNKFIGNNLEKPKIFLKRIQVRDTTQSQEVLEMQGQYQKESSMRNKAMRCMDVRAQKCAPYGGRGGKVHGSLSSIARPLINADAITTHNNFLTLPGTVISNQKGDALMFKVPFGYSHFECLLFSKTNTIIKKYDYTQPQILSKNISHHGIEAGAKETAWTMSRQVYKAKKNEGVKVGRDSVWSAIGLSSLIGFAKIKGATLQDWVLNWNTYSTQEKLKIYDEKVCHQLNTYIKYNDKPFFAEIVKPFIQNKLTKTFVDLCLLDSEKVLKYTDINQFALLNEFEKVLLVEQLVKNGKKQQAQRIVNTMESINKSERITFQQFKKQFDTIITAKLTQEAKKSQKKQGGQWGNMLRKKKAAPKKQMQMNFMAKQCQQQEAVMQCAMMDDQCQGDYDQFQDRGRFVQPFKQMQKTKQYTQTTYSGMKYPHQSRDLIPASPFWTSVAQHFLSQNDNFLSQNFIYLTKPVQFTLASCFIPNQKLLQYGLKSQGETILIEPNSSFLVFVREVKSLPYQKKFGVLLNQRFFNPDDRYYYEEDGTRIQKQTAQFVVRRPYCIQTLITNTSGTKLELQLLIDIPEGSVPLQSHENTQIQSINLEPYSTLSFERYFYFPQAGNYSLYPANACRGGSVIAKAQLTNDFEVLQVQTIKKMDTLQNVLKSGQKQAILQYLQTKNIFDSKIFDPTFFLWMLKDKQFYSKVIDILRSRKYYLTEIWMFGYYHNDIQTIRQYENIENIQNPQNILNNLPIFEYFPYYSSRAHKFLNENKSTIRNNQFKKTYFCFLFTSLFNEPTSSRSRVAFIYYLLLQDRIDDAFNLANSVDEKIKEQHKLQFDYIECFIDMYKGYPNFTKARKIAQNYVDYSVKSWQKMFKEIVDTLKQYDSEQMVEENKKVQFNTTVVNQGTNLRVSVPPQTIVEVCLYDINLQLYFSTFPFTDVNNFSSNIIPNFVQVYQSGQFREQKLMRGKQVKDCFVQVYSSTAGLKKKKISSFLWSNPNIKIKIKEENGYAQVFYENKRQAGCYCKVYQMKNGQSKFYRDGYSDITGTFKYALSDLDGITEFAILFVTENGGIVERVKPPSQQSYLA